MRSSRHIFRGFTLLELVLVMVVIAVIVAMVAPRLLGFTETRKTTEVAEMIEAMTRYARTQAVSDSTPYMLNMSGGKYWISHEVQNPDQKAAAWKAQSEFEIQHPLPNNVQLSFKSDDTGLAANVVHFYEDGRCEAGMITVRDLSQNSITQIQCPSATDSYHILKAGQ